MSDTTHKPTRGKHRATTYAPAQIPHINDVVPTDITDALIRAVEATGDTYNHTDWTFEPSTILAWAAARTTPTGTGHDLLVFSADCRTQWVNPASDPETTAGHLNRESPLSRSAIEWLLDEHTRFGTGPWHLTPIDTHGWLCTRTFRPRRRKHFIVSRDRQIQEIPNNHTETARAALTAMATAALTEDTQTAVAA